MAMNMRFATIALEIQHAPKLVAAAGDAIKVAWAKPVLALHCDISLYQQCGCGNMIVTSCWSVSTYSCLT